jgi:hypothetical protein
MRRNAFLLIIFGVIAGCGVQLQGNSNLLGAGDTPPELLAEGWLNGTAPTESELAGKVIVVDVWAYW